jgi:hypothetical protein
MCGYLKGLAYATAAQDVVELQQHVKNAVTFDCV